MLAKAVIIERDGKKCLRCGKTENLHASHIFPKGKYTKLRFDTDNLKLLCVGCHLFWWHKNPVLAGEWVRQVIEKKRYDRLLQRVMYVDSSPIDLKLIQIDLLQQLNKYKGRKRA
jgi:5-methylcytosine-specific restriction endonuclease McrA